MEKVIVVEQKPIIAYSLLKKISKEVGEKIQSLNIDTLEPTEEALASIKRIRADLSKNFKNLEDQRKMVKEIVLKDYNAFEDEYKRLIAGQFKDADEKLKTIVDTVTDKILQIKIDGIVEYFDEVNEYDFIKFDDLDLKIIKSRSDKEIKAEIDEYLASVKTSIETIETLPNKDRVLAKYQITKDLAGSISAVNIELQREQQIKEQQEAKESAEQYQPQPETCEPVQDEVFKCTFNVFATKEQLRELKKYMKEKGIQYE